MKNRSQKPVALLGCVLCLVFARGLIGQDLYVDFTQTTGLVAAGYQGYLATHEQPGTFTEQYFAAFGTTIAVAPSWSGELAADFNPQMIDRGAAQGDFFRDWIGTDCRGTLVANDPMTLTISGLPAGTYKWTSYHHDPNNQTEPFDLTINDASGSRLIINIDITAGAELPRSTVNQVIQSDGVNPITLVFDARADSDFFLCNGFEILDLDTDDDGLLDQWEIDYFGDIAAQDGEGDPDMDQASNAKENIAGSNPKDPDSDDDGLLDGFEIVTGTSPTNTDTDGDGRTDNEEVNGAVPSNPLLADTDGDLISDLDEVANGTSPQDSKQFPLVAHLQVDFVLSPNGPLELFYQPYTALHEINSLDSDPVNGQAFGVDRLNQSYAAFGTTVKLSISYPDLDRVSFTEAQLNTVKQLIDRAGYVVNYVGAKTNLVRGWIGTDARAASNGNGTNVPTTMRLAIGGLPAGTYSLRSYHHDLQNQAGSFGMRVTDADSAGVLLSTKFRQTTSSGGNLVNPGAGIGPETLRSTVTQVIRANGTDPVIVDFEKTEGATTDLSFFALNGIEIQTAVDSDLDDMIDGTETALFGNLSRDGTGDFDGDGMSDLLEILLNVDPKKSDTDDDGLKDGEELGLYATDPPALDITAFSLNTANGVVTLDWYPAVAADFEVRTSITGAPVIVPAGLTPPASFPIPAEFAGLREVYLRVVGPAGSGIGTNPFISDTDADGLKDGAETKTHGTNPLDADSDDDGAVDGQEVADGSDPNDLASLPDQDGDGYSNARERAAGSDPNDAESYPLPSSAALYVDFNSNQDEGGNSGGEADPAYSVASHNQKGYQSYHANHEEQAEFATASYFVFSTWIWLTPSWPDTTRNTVQQSIDRTDQDAAGVVVADSNDANWKGDMINLLTDWLGVDTRTSEGGNGDYDGVNGTPTRLLLTIEGLPAGYYTWRSYHHDTENAHSGFLVDISTDSGLVFAPVAGPGPIGQFYMTDSTPGGTPASAVVYNGYPTPGSSDPADLPSTVNASFTANGIDAVVIQFTPLTDTNTHRRLWGINGFELVKAPQ